MNDPIWIKKARSYIGVHEDTIVGKNLITKWLTKLGGGWLNYTAPWCGTFVANMLVDSGRWIPRYWFRAKSYATEKMTKLDRPAYGCVAVFNRRGGGHVGFVVGVTERGDLCILSGNQGDMVSIKAFSKKRLIGCYWPSTLSELIVVKRHPFPSRYNLPILNYDMSVKES